MKTTLNTWQVADALRADDNANWSSNGSWALAEYLEGLEEDLGEEMELDVVAIRCDYSEYESAFDAATDYGYEFDGDEDEQEAEALEWLQERTTVVEFDGGVIVQAF